MSGPGDLVTTTPDRLDHSRSDPLVDALFPRVSESAEWELERVRRALRALDDPHRRFPSVHVGGTNGKGSVSAMLHSVLRAAGHRVGLYTSPHLCSFRERFIVGDGPVGESVLLSAGEEVRRTVEEEGLTFFEAATVLAFCVFAEAEVDVAVAEVGLGGRLDATNVLTPLVSLVTNVSMDHAEYLGRDLAAIAREKAGIIKPGIPAIVAEKDPDLVAVLRRMALARGAPFRALDPVRDIEGLEVTGDTTAFAMRTAPWGTLELRTGLVGGHQATNAALAVAALEWLPSSLLPGAAAVVEGIASARWPGRNQVETIDGCVWLFDVAHNIAGVGALADTLDRLDLPRPWVALIGISRDKDWSAMLPPLLARFTTAWLTRPAVGPEGRSWEPAEAAAKLRGGSKARSLPLHVEPDFGRALRGAREEAGEGTVVVTGSVYTVGSAFLALNRSPFGLVDHG
jgi:dihydrofolate synthase/folylpolyglutamate synthase